MMTSLRGRLLLWYTAMLTAVMLVFGTLVCYLGCRAPLADVDAALQNRAIALATGLRPVGLTFVPHLVPMIRGIHATLYARLTRKADLQALYEERYASEALVDVRPAGSHPDTRSVRGANTCRIAVHQPRGDTAGVLSVIDNLVKGASGQAVQNMNIMFGLPETTGLEQIALLP